MNHDKTMKRFRISGVKQTIIEEITIPQEIPEGWALVKLLAVPLCTEYKGWLKGEHYPGHEGAGEVVGVKGENLNVKVGDFVALMPGTPCRHCELCLSGDYIHCKNWLDYEKITGQTFDTHVQYMLKPAWLLAIIPEGVSVDSGSMACCGLGPTIGALEHMKADAHDTILITGGGPVGLGGVVNAKFRDCKVILVVGSPYRQKLARNLGADLVIDRKDRNIEKKINEFTNNRGVDGSLECAGAVEAQMLCIKSTRRLGFVSLIGECSEPMPLEASSHLIQSGISLFGQWHFNINIIPEIMQVIKDSPVINKMITHAFPLFKINEALELDATRETGKIIIRPWE